MSTQTTTCIVCPKGCQIEVRMAADGAVASIEGNECDLGRDYAREEALSPMRVLTLALNVPGALEPLSVKTSAPIPKGLMRQAAEEAYAAAKSIALPVLAGDVVMSNVCGTGIGLVATKRLK